MEFEDDWSGAANVATRYAAPRLCYRGGYAAWSSRWRGRAEKLRSFLSTRSATRNSVTPRNTTTPHPRTIKTQTSICPK